MSRRVVYLQGPTLVLHPLADRQIIEDAYADDPEMARAEWGGEFRSDVTAYLADEVIDRALSPGERSRPRDPGLAYCAFIDAAGGDGADAMTCAIAHQGDDGRVYLDQLLAIEPPFDTEAAVERCTLTMKAFGLNSARSDKYAGDWPRDRFLRHGISIIHSELSKSQIYAEVAPLFMSGRVQLLDDARLITELRGLERRPKAGGRGDAIDHAPGRGSHDDRINSAAGAALMASKMMPVDRMANFGESRGQQVSGLDYDPYARHEREQSNLLQRYG